MTIVVVFEGNGGASAVEWGSFRPSGSWYGRKSAAGQIEIGQGEQREYLCAVFGNAAIAHFAIAELAFQRLTPNDLTLADGAGS